MPDDDSENWLDMLGNQYRRKILRLLAFRPMYPQEMARILGISPHAVHKHLEQLEQSGIVKKEKIPRDTGGRELVVFHLPRKAFFTFDLANPSYCRVKYSKNRWQRDDNENWKTITINEPETDLQIEEKSEDFIKIKTEMNKLLKCQIKVQELDNERLELLHKQEEITQTIIEKFNDKKLAKIILLLYQGLLGKYQTTKLWSPKDVIMITGVDYDTAFKLITILEKKLQLAEFVSSDDKEMKNFSRNPQWKLKEIDNATVNPTHSN